MPNAAASKLATAIDRYLADLRLQNASPHTIRNYASDLEQFASYFTPPSQRPPAPAEFTVLQIREWLGDLYHRRLSPVSVRRKLASVRSLFQFLAKHGGVPTNVARLVKTPKAPQRLPAVPTAEQTNELIDAVAEDRLERPFPERDRLIFELLYGCGLRISELVGLDLDDFDTREQWIRVRGKGRKERQVPYGATAAAALEKYLAVRSVKPREKALFANHLRTRLSDRGARGIVKRAPDPRLAWGCLIGSAAVLTMGLLGTHSRESWVAAGVAIVGRLSAVRDGQALFSGGLKNLFALADLKMNRLLGTFDEWARSHAREADVGPPERFAPTRAPESSTLKLDLRNGEIRSIVWATGFQPDYSWLDLPVIDNKGHLRHDGGVVDAPGLYALGLPFLRRRKSTFISGADDDARELVDHLAGYLATPA